MDTQDQPAEATQAESPSIVDRVASQFGLKDDPEEQQEAATAPNPEEVEAPTEDELAEVEYEGQRYQVPKPLEKAILQERDYTQKSQSVADKQRTFEVLQEQGRVQQMRAQFEAEISQEVAQIRAYDSVLAQKPDWDKLSDSEIARTMAQRNQWKEERDELDRSLNVKFNQYTQRREETIKEIRGKAAEVISKKIPSWNETLAKEVREHAKSDGYTDIELQSMDLDPRHAATLYKAAQYDKLMASKAKAVQTATKAPPMVKPGTTRPMPQAVKNDLALKKAQASATNSSERARIIQQRLEGRF
jgi:hypothetical protein